MTVTVLEPNMNSHRDFHIEKDYSYTRNILEFYH